MTLTNWLLSLAVLLLGASNLLTLYFLNENNAKWMRMFSAHSLGINPASMELKPENPKPAQPKQDLRKRVSIPLPLGGIPRPS